MEILLFWLRAHNSPLAGTGLEAHDSSDEPILVELFPTSSSKKKLIKSLKNKK